MMSGAARFTEVPRRSRTAWGMLSLCCLLPVTAHGAEQDNPESMVITASRVGAEREDSPQVVRILTHEQIQQQRRLTSDSSEILSNLLPSYSPPRQKMTGSGETLRGRTPLVMIDGIPQSNPLRPTGRELHTIDFAMVDHIEVLQGANATNGLGASGGVINIITRRPEPGSFTQHIEAQVTTPTSQLKSETTGYKTTYGFSGNKGKLDYVFSLGYEQQGLYLDGDNKAVGVDNTQGDLMDSRSYDLLAKGGWWFNDDQRLQLSFNHYTVRGQDEYVDVPGDRTRDIATTSERGDPEGEAPYNKVSTTGLTYDDYDLAGMHLNLLAFYQDYKALFGADNSSTFQDPSIAPVGTLYDQSYATTTKYGTKASLTRDDLWDDRLKLTVGFDTLFDSSEQSLRRTDRTYVPKVDYTDLAPFVQLEVTPIEALTLTAGARYEYAHLDVDDYRTVASRGGGVEVAGGSQSFNETLYNAGVVWRPVKHWSLFANYSEGFEIPDVGRALRGISTPGQSADDFENLRPIVTDNIETGVRYDDGRLDAELSYYVSSSDFGSRVTSGPGGQFVMNRQKTEIDGIDATIGYQFTPKHHGSLSYSHMRGRYDSNDDGSLDAKLDGLNVSPDRLIARWSAQWSPEWSSMVQVNHAFDRSFDDSANGWDRDFDGYTLVDAAIGHKLPVGQVNVGLANLFDERYITYYSQSALDSPDAEYMNERYFAGRGRTLTVGYSLKF
ncbi:TonB-dependent receptor [Kushneria marisflavi]|uniref:TonB-dependent receptor n=1 Tax=Kushneria marisflavi TaxID=157779 RepID=UPI000FF3F8B1|nr:TonB-dependent receptor [Kushneria marisflavi]RKD83957.1 iron complex outermembrane receptor protein [Kushneria marisflavi]